MTVQELMERVGINQTGRAVAYVKDGLEEIGILAESEVNTTRIDITKDKRFYDFPNDMMKVLDVRCKDHLNSLGEYRSIPRLIGNLTNKDSDGV